MSVVESRYVEFSEQLDEQPSVVGLVAIENFRKLPYGKFYLDQGVKPLFYLTENIVVAALPEERKVVAINTNTNVFAREHVTTLFVTNGVLYTKEFSHSVHRVKGFDPHHPRLVEGLRIQIYKDGESLLGDVVFAHRED